MDEDCNSLPQAPTPIADVPSGKHALLIGIDHYPLIPGSELSGALNDVEAMASYLEEALSFHDEEIYRLVNRAATRKGILTAFEVLLQEVVADDLVIVHFSGHGSRRPNPDQRDGSGWDETLVPCDSGRGNHADRDITCQEVRAFLLRLTSVTRRVTVIFDCCHSGTLTRDISLRGVRYVAPGPGVGGIESSAKSASRPKWWSYDRSYTFISACRSNEIAREILVPAGGVQHGALTYHLLMELRSAGKRDTYRDVFERLQLEFRSRGYSQCPQLEGAIDRRLFGLQDLRPPRFVSIRERDAASGVITLAGGAAHGITEGSRWTVFPIGSQSLESSRVLGVLEARSVGAVESTCKVLRERSPGLITAGCRAIETWPSPKTPKLRIRVRTDPDLTEVAEKVIQELRISRFVEPATHGATEEAVIYLLSPRDEPAGAELASHLGPLHEATYAVMSPDGSLMMPIRSLDRVLAIPNLIENLEDRCRWRQALLLRNRGSDRLAGLVSLDLLRFGPDGSPSLAGANPSFEDGEAFGLSITNRSNRALHVYVIHFSADGEISPIYPPQGAWQPIEPGGTAETGLKEGDELYFEVHPDLPYDGRSGPVEITETLKLIATTEATDLLPFYQGSYRETASDLGTSSKLGALIQCALWGSTPRNVRRRELNRGLDLWTTLERSIRLLRKVNPQGEIFAEQLA